MNNTTRSHLFAYLIKCGVFACLSFITVTSDLFAQIVPCSQRVINNTTFSYTGPGVAPARWNVNQADTGNAHLDQTAFSYVSTGNFSTVNTNFSGGTNNSTRQYAVVTNPNTLSPQYANIPTDGMLVINPLQGQNDQYVTYTLGGLVPGNTYNIEIKVWNVIDLAMPNQCQSWCNWNDQLFIDMQDNQAGAEHSNQNGQNWTGTNGSGNWSQGTNQVNNILKISSGGAYAIITGTMVMPTSGNQLTITLAKGSSSNPVVLGIDYIKVYGCQKEALNISGGTPNVCEASQFTLTAQGIGPAGSTYQWYHNGNLIPGSTSDTLNVVSGIVPGVKDIYKAVGQWDNVSDTLIPKLCCSSVDGTSDEVFRQSFNGLTYKSYPCGGTTYGGYSDIPGIKVTSFIDPSYTYAGTLGDANACNATLNDGQYAIVQNSFAGQYWKNRPEVFDHTGVPGSGALFINAIGGVGQIFYKSSFSSSLCDSTTYDFSIWYASLATGSEVVPNIEFDIINTSTNAIVASAFTGAIPTNEQWYQADVTFTTPKTGSPTYSLQAINLVSGSGGNDLMLDDIVVKKCTPGINLYENGTTDSVISVCDNNPVDITVNTFYSLPLEITGSTTGTVYYQWMDSTAGGHWTNIGTPVTTGTYSAIATATTTYYRAKVSANLASAATGIAPVASDCGNDAMTNSFSLTKGGNFSIPPITGTTNYCVGNTMTLTGDPGTGTQWEWRKGASSTTALPLAGYTYSSNAASKVFTKTFALADTGNYYFFSKTAAGCESYSTVTVKANPLPTIAIAATSASVCVSTSAQTSNLTYTGTTGTPNQYGITWDAAGQTAGLATVPNTTTLPTSPIQIAVPANTASGTYTGTITVSSAGGCSSTGATFTLTVNALPTVTVAATSANVCLNSSAQTSNLTYTGTAAAGTNYTITWNASALSAGLVNVASTSLPASQISLSVPANLAAATYTGTATITNAGNCSITSTFTLTVNDVLSTSDISCGPATNNTVQFNWTPLANATSYTISHTVNGGPSISDPFTASDVYTISSLNPGDAVEITVLPVGTGCFKAASFTCKSTTCPPFNLHMLDTTVCNNTLTTYTDIVSAGGTITWTNSNTSIGLGASGTGVANVLNLSFIATNTTGSPISGKIKTITTFGVCNYPDSSILTVTPDAIATLTSAASTNPETICINKAITNITYSITGTGNDATVSGLPNGVTGSYNAGVFTISGTPTQNGIFNYIVTASGTCGNGTANGIINVTPPPAISNVTPKDPTSCGGSDGSFTINGLAASSSYTVNFIKDGTAQTAQTLTSDASGNLLVSSLKQGAYTGITVASAGGCISAAATTTLSDPSVFDPVASSNSPCVGNTLNLVSTTSSDPTAVYSWTGPNNYSASGATPSITNTTVNMSGDYIVKATVSGCSSSNTVTVTINPLPVSPTPVGAAICGSGTPALSVTRSGAATDALAWYSDAALTTQVATGTNYTPAQPISVTTDYYVTETNTTGCISIPTTVTATINTVPDPPTGTGVAICGNGTAPLTATPSGPASDVLTWYSDAGLTSQLVTGTSYTTPPITSTTNYYVTETSAKGCTSTTAETITATVNQTPLPPTVSDVTYCQGDSSVPLTITSAGTNVSWYVGNDPGAAALAPVPSTAVAGSFIYYATNSNGSCESSKTPLTVTVNPISANAGPAIEVNLGQSVSLHGIFTPADATIIWSPDYAISSTSTADPIITPLVDTTYKMTVTSSLGCKASSSVNVVVFKELVIPNAFSPNGDGTNDKWVIRYIEEYAGAQVEIFNRYGQQIFQASGGPSYAGSPWDGTYQGKPVSIGAYFYIINLGNGKPPVSGSIAVIR